MTTTPPPVIRITEQEAFHEEWRRDFVRAAEQSALNMEAGWQLYNTLPHPSKAPALILVTDDPTDVTWARLVRPTALGVLWQPGGVCVEGSVVLHGGFYLEDEGIMITHWMPVPVAKKAGA
jgi:hypothetical protein